MVWGERNRGQWGFLVRIERIGFNNSNNHYKNITEYIISIIFTRKVKRKKIKTQVVQIKRIISLVSN